VGGGRVRSPETGLVRHETGETERPERLVFTATTATALFRRRSPARTTVAAIRLPNIAKSSTTARTLPGLRRRILSLRPITPAARHVVWIFAMLVAAAVGMF
jgi:hypothetical protein